MSCACHMMAEAMMAVQNKVSQIAVFYVDDVASKGPGRNKVTCLDARKGRDVQYAAGIRKRIKVGVYLFGWRPRATLE